MREDKEKGGEEREDWNRDETLREGVNESHEKKEESLLPEVPEKKEELLRKEYKYKYIGETCRSGYERGKEHLGMRETLMNLVIC